MAKKLPAVRKVAPPPATVHTDSYPCADKATQAVQDAFTHEPHSAIVSLNRELAILRRLLTRLSEAEKPSLTSINALSQTITKMAAQIDMAKFRAGEFLDKNALLEFGVTVAEVVSDALRELSPDDETFYRVSDEVNDRLRKALVELSIKHRPRAGD